MATNKAITVKELLGACLLEVANGNGSRRILISSDDEGNEYHELFFGFTHAPGKDLMGMIPIPTAKYDRDYLILG